MIDSIDFEDAKKARKILLISSFITIILQSIIEHSTGNLEFLGFKVPIEEAGVLNFYAGAFVCYSMVVFLIRYNDESLKKRFQEYKDLFDRIGDLEGPINKDSTRHANNFIGPRRVKLTQLSINAIDVLLPVLLGSFAIFLAFH